MEEIEQLKSVFRALVVSSPTQVDVNCLLRDYLKIVGKPVPLAQYGYTDPVQFLKTYFSDCFLFSGQARNPVLTLIVPNTLKYIDQCVKNQKMPSSAKYNQRRKSVPEEMVNSNIIFDQRSKPLPSIQEPIKSDFEATGTLTKVASNSFITQNQYSIGANVFSAASVMPSTSSSKAGITPHVQTGNVNTPQDINITHHNDAPSRDYSAAVKNFFKKRLPLYDSSQELKEPYQIYGQSVQDDDSKRPTSSSGGQTKAQQFLQLKSDILALITEAPLGVWCTDLFRLYRERYNRELNFSRFGYTSIISLMYCFENEVLITRPQPNGDWLLHERASACWAPPSFRPAPLHHLEAAGAVAWPASAAFEEQLDPNDALSGIDYDPDVFPEDCMQLGDSIEQVSLNDILPGAIVDVMIGEVYSPSHFWFIRLSVNMEIMMDEMTRYYNGEGRNRVLGLGAIRVGHYCASNYEGDWHRSLIVKVVDSDTAKVLHVDYGTVETVCVRSLRPLQRAWARLPAQGIRARLSGVRPAGGGSRWPLAACSALLHLVSDRRLIANVVAVDRRDAVVELLLIDTSPADDVCLGSELVRAGHADPRPDSALWPQDVYLFPRFEALENGDTPNYAEIHAYLREGIALDYVEAYRAHVPAVLPATLLPATLLPAAPAPPAPASLAAASLAAALTSAQLAPSEVIVPYQPESERSLNSGDFKSVPEVATRIPLYLRDPSNSAPSVCKLEPKAETVSTAPWEQPCHGASPLPRQSSLSPHAPEYVPAAPYVSPAPYVPAASYVPAAPYPTQHVYRAPLLDGPRLPAPLLPPYGGAPLFPLGLTLSLEECDTFQVLSHINPESAQWFMIAMMGRTLAGPFIPIHPSPTSLMHPNYRMRPPPGAHT